jgi:hypothetical protein
MRRYSWIAGCVFLIVLCYACIEPFSPPEVNSDGQYLVVDGFLNMTSDTTKIELRRSQKASDQTVSKVETGAKLWIEGEGGQRYNFQEKGKGLYILVPGKLSITQKYRLNITTSNGKQYVSDLVAVSQTPPIDSIGYHHDKGRNAVVIKVNTHDATNMTRFYRWRFEDTYEYSSAFYSSLMVKDMEVVNRPENIFRCWKTGRSESIILGSTIKLTKDEIKDLPIHTVPVETNKLLIKYSILVKQYGLTQDAFEYWTSLAKTTQSTGSLFDAQPSQVTGNIKNKNDPHELVFGYFSAAVEQEKRVFIAPHLGNYEACDADTLPVKCLDPIEECVFNTSKLLINYVGEDSIVAVPPGCADCRLRGGVNVMPSFWR